MPRVRTSPPADRFFARLDKFEAECPNCGRLIFVARDKRAYTGQQRPLSYREAKRLAPHSRRRVNTVWNPVTQRMKCPWCNTAYVCGLIAYPAPRGVRYLLDVPPDVKLEAREIAVSRLKAGGWWAAQAYERGQHVNVAVETPCSCPPRGWLAHCAVHGDPALGVEGRKSEPLPISRGSTST